MNFQNGNVAGTLQFLYEELITAKKTLEIKLVHSPGWIYKRTKIRKRGQVTELFYVYVTQGKRHYQKINPTAEVDYKRKIVGLKDIEKALNYVNEQLLQLSKCFSSLGIDPVETVSYSTNGEKKFPTNSLYPDGLRHRTFNGEMVRSKSEVLLANLLYLYQVPYEYEKAVTLNGYTFHPDFTITLPTGKQVYWEHLGMISDPKYAQNWAIKNHTYRQHGISEGNGLIITQDVNGVFDEQDALLKIKSYHLSPLT